MSVLESIQTYLPDFDDIVIWSGFALFFLMIPALLRVIKGPTAIDRIVAVNIVGTKTAVLLVVIGQAFHRVEMFVDFALAYALLNFIGSLAASRFLQRNVKEVATTEEVVSES